MAARMCAFFKAGNCKYGKECRYAHSDGRRGACCKFFADEGCYRGAGCYFLHSSKPLAQGFALEGKDPDEGAKWKKPKEATVLTLDGFGMGSEGVEYHNIQADEAEAMVRADPDTYIGWSINHDWAEGLWLMKTGYDLCRNKNYTAFILRRGRLPTTDEFACFEDDFATGKTKRPGRGQGLKDTAQDLCLFSSVLPSDIRQGSLADCWLLSAMSCLAEYPKAVMRMFRPKHLADDGKYVVKLFHPIEDKFVYVEVDDRLQVDSDGKLQYAQTTNQDEIWPCILEKAMAKLFGGYDNLEYNIPLIALKAFTQCSDLLHLTNSDGNDHWELHSTQFTRFPSWRRLSHRDWPDGAGSGSIKRSIADFYNLLHSYDQQNFLLSACTAEESAHGEVSESGIVAQHVYSILRVETNVAGSGFDLMQIRNPWAHSEWAGDWSDKSSKWDEYPAVRDALSLDVDDDGMFWISKEDFARNFKYLYIIRAEMPLSRSKERRAARKRRKDGVPSTDAPKPTLGSFDYHVDSIHTFASVLKKAKRRARLDAKNFAPVMCLIVDETGAKFPLGSESSCRFPVRIKYPIKAPGRRSAAPQELKDYTGTHGRELFSHDRATREEAFLKVVGTFQKFDTDANGVISEEELLFLLSTLLPHLSEKRLRKLMQAGDANHDGVVDYEEFVAWMYGTK